MGFNIPIETVNLFTSLPPAHAKHPARYTPALLPIMAGMLRDELVKAQGAIMTRLLAILDGVSVEYDDQVEGT